MSDVEQGAQVAQPSPDGASEKAPPAKKAKKKKPSWWATATPEQKKARVAKMQAGRQPGKAKKKAKAEEKAARPILAPQVAEVETSGAVKIKVPDLATEHAQPKRRYHFGTTPSSPVQNFTAGGMTFPRFVGRPSFDVDGEPDHPLTLGMLAWLTDAEVARIIAGVERRVIRTVGDRGRVIILDGDRRKYDYQPGDEPAAKYVYMHDVTERGQRVLDPAPMA